ncbi:MAG: response regulator transcription factor [Anaerolineaceae bacterium]|nr:response regulator transcription factor [Anaerolineaceae bacterium]
MKSNILIVDDEPIARQSLSDILQLEGFVVNSAPNGQAAVEYARTHPIELMIVDLRMPGMDGLEVVQVINQTSPQTEVILLTAFASTESAIRALRLRIHDYLLKPVSPAQVIASVQKGLLRREARLKARTGRAASEIDEGVAQIILTDGTHIDLSRRLIRKANTLAHLTPAEGRLLRILIENPGRVYTHRELVLLVQGYHTSQREAPEILRPLISRLRYKLEAFPALADQISSVRGTGYVYEGEFLKK